MFGQERVRKKRSKEETKDEMTRHMEQFFSVATGLQCRCLTLNLILIANFVTTSKAPVTTSVALVTTSSLFYGLPDMFDFPSGHVVEDERVDVLTSVVTHGAIIYCTGTVQGCHVNVAQHGVAFGPGVRNGFLHKKHSL